MYFCCFKTDFFVFFVVLLCSPYLSIFNACFDCLIQIWALNLFVHIKRLKDYLLYRVVKRNQGRNHVFKVEGPIPWSMVLLPFYTKKIRQVYPVWCSWLHNYTLFIKKLRKNLGGPSRFREGPDLPDPQWFRP